MQNHLWKIKLLTLHRVILQYCRKSLSLHLQQDCDLAFDRAL